MRPLRLWLVCTFVLATAVAFGAPGALHAHGGLKSSAPAANERVERPPRAIVLTFNEASPLGLEEWIMDSGCLLALGDGKGVNYATLSADLETRLRAQFQPAKR